MDTAASALCGSGGGKEIRTPDILLAKQVLYQLSYAPLIKLTLTEPDWWR